MKRTLHSLLTFVLSMTILCTGVIPAFASNEGVSTCLANCYNTSMNFTVVDGEAHFGVTYYAKEATFTQAKLTVQIQKKFLAFFWKDVADEWVGYCTDLDGVFVDAIPVDQTGTYRAIFKLEIFGTTDTDVIEETINSVAS